ncbi:MAG: hypothetical protein AB4063_12585 [Crocosphaera sp.]
MPLSNNIDTHLRDLDDLQSKSRFLTAQNRRKRQHRQLSMLHRLATETGVSVESWKA